MPINVLDFVASNQNLPTDWSPVLQAIALKLKDIQAAKQPLPGVLFPGGYVYQFTNWPNFAMSGLKMFSDGQAVLKHMGTGDAVSFLGDFNTPGQPGCGEPLQS